MRKNLPQHILSIIIIALIFIYLGYLFRAERTEYTGKENPLSSFVYVDLNDPLQKLILKETFLFYYPEKSGQIDSLLNTVSEKDLAEIVTRAPVYTLTWNKAADIFEMYLKFILIYLLILVFTYYGAQTLGVLRYVRKQENRSGYLERLGRYILNSERKSIMVSLKLLLKAGAKGLLYFVLFSPAYVIAYSIKTKFDTDSVFFMIVLGLISNGMLIAYTQKFLTFLESENKKGYVQAARVKGLNQDYVIKSNSQLAPRSLLKLRKSFKGHIFQHIFINAEYQNLVSLKEQAAYLISSLIIIEMALNIHNHLCYQLLQDILYKNYQSVLLIVFLIFLLVKATEIIIDQIIGYKTRQYTNIAENN